MSKLYASHSSEFFAVRDPGRLYVYRDSFLDQTHRVDDQQAGDMIHLADSGDCFFRSKDGIFRLRRERNVKAERCRAVATLDGSAEGGVLRGFAVRADGEQIAYEQVVPARKFSSKLKRFLGQKSSQGDIGPSLHRFLVSGWSGRSSSSYFETVVDPRISTGLIWWTAPDFGFLAVMERERDGRSVLRLIDVLHESVVNELVVDGKLSKDRFMTSNGTVGFGVEKNGQRSFLIWTYSQDRFQVAYPQESRVLHLSKDKAVFHNRSAHRIIAKSFSNEVLVDVSLAPLAKMGVEYLVHFNPRGSIEVVTYHNGKLRVVHTDLEQLPTDVKRWELQGEQRRAERFEEATDAVLDRESELRSSQQLDEQRQQLAHDISYGPSADPFLGHAAPTPTEQVPRSLDLEVRANERPATPLKPPAPISVDIDIPEFATIQEAQEALERLRMRYIAGEVNRESYHNEKVALEHALTKFHGGASPNERTASQESGPRTLNLHEDLSR